PILQKKRENSKISFPHSNVKKKKKKKNNALHKTKNKITRIFQLLSIKARNNRRKSNESGDLDKVSIKTDTPNSRPKKVTSEIILR
ncbi:hypothetical protein NUS50_05665, partial [Glaesserella parasuis]|nr:hypothetical protein [Glaesserella parasuis]